jgi:hypothetical protein
MMAKDDGLQPRKAVAELNLGQVARQGLINVNAFLLRVANGDDVTPKDIGSTKIALGVVSAWTRTQQTQSARDGTSAILARELARDKEEYREYIRVAIPNHPLARALPIPKKNVTPEV